MAHNKGEGGGDCGFSSWILPTIVYYGIFYILLTVIIPWMDANEKATACAVELAAFKGLQPRGASPATSPAFDLIVHVSNGHSCDLKHGGGDVVVSYAGVPLAHGLTPALQLGTKATAALPVQARSAGAVGVPGDLSRLIAGERRWGVAQLQVEFGFARDNFVCDVQLDAALPRVFDCYSLPTSSYIH